MTKKRGEPRYRLTIRDRESYEIISQVVVAASGLAERLAEIDEQAEIPAERGVYAVGDYHVQISQPALGE